MSDPKKEMPVNQDSPLTPDQRAEIAKPIEESPAAHHAPSVAETETEHVHEKKKPEAKPAAPEEIDDDEEDSDDDTPSSKGPKKAAKKGHK